MKLSVALLATISGAAAFAPAAKQQVRTALNR